MIKLSALNKLADAVTPAINTGTVAASPFVTAGYTVDPQPQQAIQAKAPSQVATPEYSAQQALAAYQSGGNSNPTNNTRTVLHLSNKDKDKLEGEPIKPAQAFTGSVQTAKGGTDWARTIQKQLAVRWDKPYGGKMSGVSATT